VRVGLKEAADPIQVCYCFGFFRADVRAELEATGRCTIADRIDARIKAGECSCEIRNPSGACCLGEVRKVIEDERIRLGPEHHDPAAVKA
jgi:hypothetical protein